jgi:RNA polymerase sigma-70 factor (ECF subfamily)
MDNDGTAVIRDASALDRESQSWWDRLHAPEPKRTHALSHLHGRLHREATFQVRRCAFGRPDFPRSDIDDLATQAADDALVALLRKLDHYRGDAQFMTWARRFAALEAHVCVRRRLGNDRIGVALEPELADLVADTRRSPQDQVEIHERLHAVTGVINDRMTPRERAVLMAVAIEGSSTDEVAGDLHMSRGAIYKALFDARVKLKRHAA